MGGGLRYKDKLPLIILFPAAYSDAVPITL